MAFLPIPKNNVNSTSCSCIKNFPDRPSQPLKLFLLLKSYSVGLPNACLPAKAYPGSETRKTRNCWNTIATLSRHALDVNLKLRKQNSGGGKPSSAFHVIINDTRYRMENCCSAEVRLFLTTILFQERGSERAQLFTWKIAAEHSELW